MTILNIANAIHNFQIFTCELNADEAIHKFVEK